MSGGDNLSTFFTSHKDSLLEIGPRPPTLPGQEEEYTKNKENIFCSSTFTPRKSNLHGFKNSEFDQCFMHCSSKSRCRCRHYESVMEDGLDGDPPLGYEPEGSSSACDSSPYAESRTPPYIKWAHNLRYLLKDCEGVELFKRYVSTEGCSDSLNFWFACEGLKKQNDPGTLQQLIRVIYRNYVRPPNTVHLVSSTKDTIRDKINSKSIMDRNIFDDAQYEEEQFISQSTYPNFLKSDIYLHYVQSMQNGAGEDVFSKNGDAVSSNNSSVPSSRSSNYGGKGDVAGPLPTVLEDSELNVSNTLTLTSSHLLATERFRVGYGDVRRPEAFAGVYLNQIPKSKLINPYHAMYGTQIPGSAQDSELQSLSSDAHTDETMSLDSSLDGRSGVVSRKYLKQQQRHMRQNANQNYDPHSQLSMIPRTNKFNPKTPVQNDPNEFAATLIKKLEEFKKSQEASEKVLESINTCNQEMEVTAKDKPNARSMPPLTTLFNAAIANIEAGDEQSILDDHVSRIWNDSAHHTPVITPGHQSPLPVPCPKSPERRRASAPAFSNKNIYYHKHRKERDLASTISSDSGAIPDYVDGEISSVSGSDSFHYYNKYSHHPGKSKSGTGSAEQVPTELGADVRERRAKESGKRSLGRKCFMDSISSGIDSGVSMANEPNQQSSSKVLDWFMANNSQPSEAEKESFARHKRSNHSSLSATSPGPNRQSRSKKQQNSFVSSRSGSTERSGHTRSTSAAQPSQPIMGVHSMPMLPPPNTTTQLEEARRRLEDDPKSKLSKSKTGISIKERVPDLVKGVRASMKSSINTEIVLDLGEDPSHSRKNIKKCSSSNSSLVTTPITQVVPEVEYTVVGYQFGEDVPYLSKLAGKNITLKQFKTLVTKKENFRYFFKKADNEFGTGIVYEEIGNDNEVLPLWEGKLFAKLEVID